MNTLISKFILKVNGGKVLLRMDTSKASQFVPSHWLKLAEYKQSSPNIISSHCKSHSTTTTSRSNHNHRGFSRSISSKSLPNKYDDQLTTEHNRTYTTSSRSSKSNQGKRKYPDDQRSHNGRRNYKDQYSSSSCQASSNWREVERLNINKAAKEPGYYSHHHSSQSEVEAANHTTTNSSRRGARIDKRFVLQRQWRDIYQIPRHLSSRDRTRLKRSAFSILSYNILAQTLLHNNSYLYNDCADHVLPWEYRWNNLQSEIKSFNASIVCLQEVEKCHFDEQIRPFLQSEGYYVYYKKRTGNLQLKPDGVLIAVKRSMFSVVKVVPVDYLRKGHELTKWENVGLILLLESKLTDTKICVANTHLLYNPKRGDGKLVQLITLLAEVERVRSNNPDRHGNPPLVLLCGDFNSTPKSPIYDFVTRAFLNYENLSARMLSGQRAGSGGSLFKQNIIPKVLNINPDCTFKDESPPSTPPPPGDEEAHPTSQPPHKPAPTLPVVSHRIPLTSSGGRHQQWEATTMQDDGITVDYIFYTTPASWIVDNDDDEDRQRRRRSPPPPELILKGYLAPCSGHDINAVGGLPNQHHSSDHLPMFASFYVT